MLVAIATLLALGQRASAANSNGAARTPPMGKPRACSHCTSACSHCTLATDCRTALQQLLLLLTLPAAGWRSWNFYACEISAAVFERQIDALADRSRTVGGKPTSLADLGYATVGIDDCWQDCTSPDSFNGSFHDKDGKPLVDASRFPGGGLRALADKGTAKGIGLGWYG